MKPASEMTVEEMGATLGLRRDERLGGWWHWSDRTGVVAEPESARAPIGAWFSWPEGGSYEGGEWHESEHAAMSRLHDLRFPETTGTPTPTPIVEPGGDTARESGMLETEPDGTRERWRFTVALAVVVDGRACIEFQRRITESALVALLTPRADRGDVLALARDCDDMERHCAYDRRTGRPFAFVERNA